ncbi:unnamed protein product [Cylicocyclus nassatus]|uniref:Uncharacterized protein n=1 Tax=Cylicocyclus nassatus TaxID=53992 RepID=A0AA36H3F0_CYLNA|nr:unnamed protein product [Cylicocyclus nassatus]
MNYLRAPNWSALKNSASEDLESMMKGLTPQQQLDLLTKLDLFFAGEDIVNRRPRPGASPVTGLGPRRSPPRVARPRAGSFLTSYTRPTIAPFNFRTTDAPAERVHVENLGGPGREASPYAKELGFDKTV